MQLLKGKVTNLRKKEVTNSKKKKSKQPSPSSDTSSYIKAYVCSFSLDGQYVEIKVDQGFYNEIKENHVVAIVREDSGKMRYFENFTTNSSSKLWGLYAGSLGSFVLGGFFLLNNELDLGQIVLATFVIGVGFYEIWRALRIHYAKRLVVNAIKSWEDWEQ